MTNQEILEKAIQKAIDGGWLPPSHSWDLDMTKDNLEWHITEGVKEIPFGVNVKGRIYMSSAERINIAELIFNHDFAKALWQPEPNYSLLCPKCEGEYNWWDKKQTKAYGFPPSKYCNADGTKLKKVVDHYSHPWQYHLKNMVISPDPIKYLGENL